MRQKNDRIQLQRILAIFVLFMLVFFAGNGCSESSSSSSSKDKGGIKNGSTDNGDDNGDISGNEQISFRLAETSYSADICVGTYFSSDNETSIVGGDGEDFTMMIDYNGKGPGSFQGVGSFVSPPFMSYSADNLSITISSYGNKGGLITGTFSGTFVSQFDENDTIEVTSGTFSASRTL